MLNLVDPVTLLKSSRGYWIDKSDGLHTRQGLLRFSREL
jgi:hypothetical protein